MDSTLAVAVPKPKLATPAFLSVVFAALAYFFAVGVLVPAVPRYVAGPLGAGDASVGIVVGAFSVSALLLRPWAGRLADRRGRALLMISGAGIVAVSVAGYALVASVPALLVLRLVTGVGEALFWVGAVSAVGDLAPPQRRGEAMSWASLSLYVGLALGPPVGEYVVDQFGYVTAWLVSSAAAAVALAIALRVGETRPEAETLTPEVAPETRTPEVGPEARATAGAGSGADGGRRARLRLVHPDALLPAAMLLTVIWGMAGLLTFVPLYARDLGLSSSGPVLFGFAGMVVVIRSFGARLPDRLGTARATVAALAGVTLGLTVIGLWRTPAGLIVGALALAVGVALATPSIMALAWEAAPAAERGAATSTVAMAVDVGLGFGPAALGLVAAQTGRPGAYLAAAVVAALGLALALWSARSRRAASIAARTFPGPSSPEGATVRN